MHIFSLLFWSQIEFTRQFADRKILRANKIFVVQIFRLVEMTEKIGKQSVWCRR